MQLFLHFKATITSFLVAFNCTNWITDARKVLLSSPSLRSPCHGVSLSDPAALPSAFCLVPILHSSPTVIRCIVHFGCSSLRLSWNVSFTDNIEDADPTAKYTVYNRYLLEARSALEKIASAPTLPTFNPTLRGGASFGCIEQSIMVSDKEIFVATDTVQ